MKQMLISVYKFKRYAVLKNVFCTIFCCFGCVLGKIRWLIFTQELIDDQPDATRGHFHFPTVFIASEKLGKGKRKKLYC